LIATFIIKLTPSTSLKYLGVVLLFVLFTHVSYGQNTKGDKPVSTRENRFKTSPRKEKVKKSSVKASPRGRARGGERAGRPIRPIWNVHKPKETQRAWKGDLTGRRLEHKNKSSDKHKPKIYRQTGPSVRRRVPDREGRQNVARGRPTRIPSATGKIKNVYPQKGPYVSNPSTTPRTTQKAVSNKVALARLKKLETPGKNDPQGKGKKVRVVPRSASRPYIHNKSINVWANFRRPKKKGPVAQTTDLAGRRIRGRNYETPKAGLIKAKNVYKGRRITGKDRPYSGPGGYNKSATAKATAWIGDIAGRIIRHRDKSSKSVEGNPIRARRYKSASQSGEKRTGTTPIPVKKPGYGATGLGAGGHRQRGGKRVNTSGVPIRSKYGVGFGYQGERARGNKVSSRKRVDVSGIPVKSKYGVGFGYQGERARGNKASTRKRVNISGIPVRSKYGVGFNDQGEESAFRSKTKKPAKGGGSVSGKVFNNNGSPLAPRIPKNAANLARVPGSFKSKRPAKGGGSVSGQLWNNKETAIPPKAPSQSARDAAAFRGRNKMFELQPGFTNQGEEFRGEIKHSRFRKAYVQNKLADKESIKKQRPQKETYAVEGLQIKVKRAPFVRNKNVSDDALLKKKQTKTDQEVAGLQLKVKRRDYVTNKNISENALKKLKPTETDKAVADLQVKVKQYHYIRNPSSSSEALKVREPGKAFARVSDYQGNIKMQKFALFEKNRGLHPDARFVKTNKNNVKEERDAVTNLKLWWARLFKKQENQPEHLKEKLKQPRYDKGEQGMWYD
jgi:hypothetical protein